MTPSCIVRYNQISKKFCSSIFAIFRSSLHSRSSLIFDWELKASWELNCILGRFSDNAIFEIGVIPSMWHLSYLSASICRPSCFVLIGFDTILLPYAEVPYLSMCEIQCWNIRSIMLRTRIYILKYIYYNTGYCMIYHQFKAE